MRRTITTNLYAFNVASASGPAKRLEAPRGLARELFNYETGGQKEKAAELFQATFGNIVVAHTDKLRNFFLSPPTEMLSFLQQLREVLV